ncbi:hypothetical protein CMO94_04205 [Candidatus Woesearchaeota archaeon]|nr:hypothetical protein [Candidatus Woesearchaeota archaeon]
MSYLMIGKGGLLTLEERAKALQSTEKALRDGVCYQTSFDFDESGNSYLINGLQPPDYKFVGSPDNTLGGIVQTEEEMLQYEKKSPVRDKLTNLWNKVPEILRDFITQQTTPHVAFYEVGTYLKI